MTRRKSVQELVRPLRKLTLLTGHSSKSLSLVPEQTIQCHEQPTFLSRLPHEIALTILRFLPFEDLVRVQLTCRRWRTIAQDISIWRTRYQSLCKKYPDIHLHLQTTKINDLTNLSWQTRYCQAISSTNWRMGSVQRLCKISCEGGRILSIKLRANILVTLNEDNCVRLYEYSTSNGFQLQIKWTFGDVSQPANVVECIDILPEINILVVALRGSKCIFYDINKKNPREPIQVLKGGSHPSFVPDSIALNQDYFAVLGRKPSALFVWHWRKGVRLANKAFDNQPHSVYLSDHHVVTISVDGIAHAFDILDQTKSAVPHTLPPCSMPSVEYDGSLSMVLAPFQSRRIHHFQWTPLPSKDISGDNLLSLLPTQSISTPHSSPPQMSSPSSTQAPAPSIPTPSPSPTPPSPRRNLLPSLLSRHKKKEKEPRDPLLMRLRRHSSYNDYGYACQMRTAHYIKQQQHPHSHFYSPTTSIRTPDFSHKPALIHSIRTSPLGRTALEIINVATHNGRVATLNRHGDIALYALNGTTAARVSLPTGECEWIEPAADHSRQDDRLSDGYDFVRSRLAMGPMGIVYGGREGDVWWMDFGCRPNFF